MRALLGWLALGAAALAISAMRATRAPSEFVGPTMPEQSQTWQRNRAAFLSTLRYAEGTADANGYRALYGHTASRPKLFGNLNGHPAETGEWAGELLPAAMCAAAGFSAGCKTTAAGAYQANLPTWIDFKRATGASDMLPATQDRFALWLLERIGALAYVDAGDFDQAVSVARSRWASLPGAGVGQPEKSLALLRSVYQSAGGNLY